MAAKRRKVVAEDINLGVGPTTIPTDSGGTRAASLMGLHTFLGDSAISPSTFSGDFGAQIQSAHDALPDTGGVIDARGTGGIQSIAATVTISKPVLLLLSECTITVAASTGFSATASFAIHGSNRGTTIFQQSSTAGTIVDVQCVGSFHLENLTIQSQSAQTAGAGVSITGTGVLANQNTVISQCVFSGQYIALDFGQAIAYRVIDCKFQAEQHRGIRINNSVNGDDGDNYIHLNDFSGPGVAFVAGTVAIEYIAGGGLMIHDNKFQLHDYAIQVNWNTSADTSQLSIHDNHIEAQSTGGAAISMTRTAGSLSGVSIVGNYYTTNAAGFGNFLDIPANGTLWMADLVVANNNIIFGTAGIAFNVSGFAAAQGLFIANHVAGNAGTSQSFKFGANLASIRVWGNMNLGCGVADAFASGLRGNYEPDNLGIGITADATLTELLSLPNASYIAFRNAGASGWLRTIGLDGSDNVLIGDNTNITTKIQGPAIINADGSVNASQINCIQRLTPNLTPGSVGANTSAEEVYTISGLDPQDICIVQPPSGVAGIGLVSVRVGTNQLALNWMNSSSGSLTPPAGIYQILAIRAYPV